MTCVNGLDAALLDCYERGLLPAEAGVRWAHAGRTVLVDPASLNSNPPTLEHARR
jgi:hypothetical protein